MTYDAVLKNPPLHFAVSAWVLDEKRPAQATGSWPKVWQRFERLTPRPS